MRAPSAIVLRHHRAHRPRDLAAEPHAVFERAAVVVGALVGDRRQKRMRQIAVRVVQLDRVEADPHRALRRIDECLAHPRDVGLVHRARRVPAVAERNRRRRHGRPRILSGLERTAALPGPLRRSLAAGVRELDAELGGADPRQCAMTRCIACLVGVGIEPGAAVGDAAVPLDVGRLDHQQAGAGIRQHAEMRHVPVGRAAVIGAVLAHRRDHDAVGEFETGEPDGENRADMDFLDAVLKAGRGCRRIEKPPRRKPIIKSTTMAASLPVPLQAGNQVVAGRVIWLTSTGICPMAILDDDNELVLS